MPIVNLISKKSSAFEPQKATEAPVVQVEIGRYGSQSCQAKKAYPGARFLLSSRACGGWPLRACADRPVSSHSAACRKSGTRGPRTRRFLHEIGNRRQQWRGRL